MAPKTIFMKKHIEFLSEVQGMATSPSSGAALLLSDHWGLAPCPVTHSLCPGWRSWMPLCPEQVQPIAKLSKYARDTWGTNTPTALPSAAFTHRTHVKQRSESPSSFLPDRDRRLIVWPHTQHSGFTSTHTFVNPAQPL